MVGTRILGSEPARTLRLMGTLAKNRGLARWGGEERPSQHPEAGCSGPSTAQPSCSPRLVSWPHKPLFLAIFLCLCLSPPCLHYLPLASRLLEANRLWGDRWIGLSPPPPVPAAYFMPCSPTTGRGGEG